MKIVTSSGENERKPLSETLKHAITTIGTIAAILGILAYAGCQPEKRKLLEWVYLSKSSLLNTAAGTTENIRILYGERRISQLTVVSARLFNSGDIPIDSGDVKDGGFPSITFPAGLSVLGAEIKALHPSNLLAKVVWATNFVRLEHGLLNPSDWIELQIVMEGEVGAITSLPDVAYRIKGITEPLTVFPYEQADELGVALFRFSRVTEYFLLTLTAFLPIGLLLMTLFLGMQVIHKYRYLKRLPLRRLRREIIQKAPVLDEIERSSIADFYEKNLNGKIAVQIRNYILAAPLNLNEQTDEFLRRVEREIVDRLLPKGVWGRVKLLNWNDDIVPVLLFGILGVASALVVAGSFARVL